MPNFIRGAKNFIEQRLGRMLSDEERPTPVEATPAVPTGKIHRDEIAELNGSFIGLHGRETESGADLIDQIGKQRIDCKLVLCCAFTGRHRILEKIINESLSANTGASVFWMLTGSTPEDRAFINSMSIKTGQVAGFVVENNPLGRKWQSCLHIATKYYNSELYGITGSDDFVSQQLVDYIIDRHSVNLSLADGDPFLPSMYGTLEWLLISTDKRGTMAPVILKCSYAYETAFEPLGAGRFYTREFLEERNGIIFESDKERLLDDRGFFDLRDSGKSLEYYSVEQGPLVSVKGDWAQMNAIEAFLEANTLTLQEYSFRGHGILSKALTTASQGYLFRPPEIDPQLSFSGPQLGMEVEAQPDAPANLLIQPELQNKTYA